MRATQCDDCHPTVISNGPRLERASVVDWLLLSPEKRNYICFGVSIGDLSSSIVSIQRCITVVGMWGACVLPTVKRAEV